MFQVGESTYFPVVRSDFIETPVPKTGFLMLQFRRDYEVAIMPIA